MAERQLFNVQQLLTELGRLHMENLALRSEREQLMAAMSVMAGPAEVIPGGDESESEGDPRDPSGPSGDGLPGTDG